MIIEMFFFIALLAFIAEYIDAGFGMGYGTILSPVLIIMGFNPLLVIPSLLISQAFGGFIASFFHYKFKHVDFKVYEEVTKEKNYFGRLREKFTRDFKITTIIIILGILAVIFASLVAINIPKIYLKTYIGLLVLGLGILMAAGLHFKFSRRNIIGIGLISAFNKGISGGGFGPLTTSGQIISGHDHKASIGITTAAEAPICIAGFLTYLIASGSFDFTLALPLFIGAILAAPLGALTTKKINKKMMLKIISIVIIILGIWTLLKTWVF